MHSALDLIFLNSIYKMLDLSPLVCLQAAVRSVALTVDNIHQFLAISSTPIIGALCRAFPGKCARLLGKELMPSSLPPLVLKTLVGSP